MHIFGYNFFSNQQESIVDELRENLHILSLDNIALSDSSANFLNNKKIGDELCYVYNRKNETKRMGNTLEKPCMLLKRTFNRDTTFEEE